MKITNLPTQNIHRADCVSIRCPCCGENRRAQAISFLSIDVGVTAKIVKCSLFERLLTGKTNKTVYACATCGATYEEYIEDPVAL